MNVIERAPIVIELLDESGAPAMTWNLANLFVTKINVADMNADGNEIAVEAIKLAHEGSTIKGK